MCVKFLFRSLSVGTVSGYQLYAVSSVESLDKIYETGMYCIQPNTHIFNQIYHCHQH